jgi:hypothetical protein
MHASLGCEAIADRLTMLACINTPLMDSPQIETPKTPWYIAPGLPAGFFDTSSYLELPRYHGLPFPSKQGFSFESKQP